jgi:4-hydroxybenzoate polyprenyltransferase
MAVRDWLRLVRLPLAPTAAFDAVACLALARAAAGLPVGTAAPLEVALLAATSLLVYGAGMAANDWADRERDRAIAPGRPLPSGRIAPGAALALALLLAAGALALGGGPSGSRAAVATALALAFAYDLLAKRFVVPGAATMGSVRAANGSVGVWPLVLSGAAPATALLGPLALGLYSAAVTLWSTTEEDDAPARRVVARGLAAAAFALAGVASVLASGALTVGAFVAFGGVSSLLAARTPRPGPVKRQVLEMLLGLYFVSFCLASAADGGSLAAALAALGLALLLIWTSQRLVRWLR